MISIPNLPPVSIDTALYLGRAAFLVISFVLAAAAFARVRRGAARDAQHTADGLARVLERLESLEARMASGEAKLAAIAEQIETYCESTAAAASQSYAVAVRLARSGARAEDLMTGCGLARHEAELVVRLHGLQRPRAVPAGPRAEGDARHVALMRA